MALGQFFQIIKFEFSRQKILFLVWTISWLLMAIFAFAFYDDAFADPAALEVFLNSFPKELLEAFGSSSENFFKITGYFNTQFTSIYFIAASILGIFLGVRTVAGEIANRSILVLLDRPVARHTILLGKFAALLLWSVVVTVALMIPTAWAADALTSYEPVPYKFFFFTGVAMLLFKLFFASLGLALGTFFDNTRALAIGILYGIVSFFINSLSSVKGFPSELSYLTLYKYVDLNTLATEEILQANSILLIVLLIVALVGLSLWRFGRMDIHS